MQKVIPRGLNYADIAPEAIDCNIKMVKMTPTATTHSAQQNDIIQFQLQGSGFLDPYSTYLRFTVDVDPANGQGFPAPTSFEHGGFHAKVLDRSAHSFINRWILRSNGVELERIENYDVMAAMLNDVTYSREQTSIHFNEGFATAELPQGFGHEYTKSVGYMRYKANSAGVENYTGGLNLAGGTEEEKKDLAANQVPGVPFWATGLKADQAAGGLASTEENEKIYVTKIGAVWNYQSLALSYNSGNQFYSSVGEPVFYKKINVLVEQGPEAYNNSIYAPEDYFNTVTTNATQTIGQLASHQVCKVYNKSGSEVAAAGNSFGIHTTAEGSLVEGGQDRNVRKCTRLTFTIPLYSGILGVLMPEKKFIPLSILPLNLELTLNPHALYLIGPDSLIKTGQLNRNYTINDIQLCGHMLTFEQDIHRSLETVIAQNGLMLHYNTFYLTPTMIINGTTLPAYAQINMAFKSIKSIHFLFYYSSYTSNQRRRKLHFVSHQLEKLQLRNGIELMPSEPIEGNAGCIANFGNATNYNCTQFYTEMLKSWNKMHEISTDSQISAYSFAQDTLSNGHAEAFFQSLQNKFQTENPYVDTNPINGSSKIYDNTNIQNPSIPLNARFNMLMKAMVHDQLLVGRSQFGFALEGEELGQDKSILSGRKGSLPFDINFSGKPRQLQNLAQNDNTYSQMNTFLLLDMIVYVRPDLVVTVLGK